jgi:hypothetical protein
MGGKSSSRMQTGAACGGSRVRSPHAQPCSNQPLPYIQIQLLYQLNLSNTPSTNLIRYAPSDEELEGEPGADGAPRPRARGADLAQLLRDTEPLYSQAHYRHRALLRDGGEGDGAPPAVDAAAAAEGLLSLDLEALAGSLAALPLRELLGVGAAYCGVEGGLLDDGGEGGEGAAPALGPAAAAAGASGRTPQLAAAAAGAARPLVTAGPAAAAPAANVTLPPVLAAAAAASRSAAVVASAPATTAAQAAAPAAAAGDDADLDALLGILGCDDAGPSAAAAVGGRAPQPAAAPLVQPSSSGRAAPAVVAPLVANAAAAPTIKPALAPVVAAVPPPAAVSQRPPATQSVEDWLDSL